MRQFERNKYTEQRLGLLHPLPLDAQGEKIHGLTLHGRGNDL